MQPFDKFYHRGHVVIWTVIQSLCLSAWLTVFWCHQNHLTVRYNGCAYVNFLLFWHALIAHSAVPFAQPSGGSDVFESPQDPSERNTGKFFLLRYTCVLYIHACMWLKIDFSQLGWIFGEKSRKTTVAYARRSYIPRKCERERETERSFDVENYMSIRFMCVMPWCVLLTALTARCKWHLIDKLAVHYATLQPWNIQPAICFIW